jgi:hypothetical protein
MSEEYTGGSVGYYKTWISNPTTPGVKPYMAECNDIIEALEMNYAEANIFKANWRRAAARQGKQKRGYTDGLYDAEKMVFFSERVVVQEKYANKRADPFPDTALDLDTTGDERIDQIGRNGNDGEHYAGIWHHWTGGECPCDELSMVEGEYRDGVRQTTEAGTFVWCHDGDESDIIRYRML